MYEAATRFIGNPSSLHEEGRAARQLIEQARSAVAELLGAHSTEVVFTSGGSESNNTAILGAAHAALQARGRRGQVISSPLEHPSISAALQVLREDGFKITHLPVSADGRIDPADLRTALSAEETALVSLSMCNHELGNIYPIAEFVRLSHEYGALFHCDAVQAAGRMPIDVAQIDVDLLSVSAHKLYGPKGVGALFLRAAHRSGKTSKQPRLPGLDPLLPLIRGGSQEKGRRAGTENVAGIVGFGTASGLCSRELTQNAEFVTGLRDRLEARLLQIAGARRNGDVSSRSAGTANLAFAGVEGELLFMNLDLRGIAVSTGAACSSGSPEPSAVLLALGLSRTQALEAVRFSLGPKNTVEEVDTIADAVLASVNLIRQTKQAPLAKREF